MPELNLCPDCSTPLPGAATCCPTCCARKRARVSGSPSTMAMAGLLGLSITAMGCPGGMQADYGIAETGWEDEDGDGWTVEDGDCDDADPDIHPEAEETPGDGVDSNCDGEDDT